MSRMKTTTTTMTRSVIESSCSGLLGSRSSKGKVKEGEMAFCGIEHYLIYLSKSNKACIWLDGGWVIFMRWLVGWAFSD